MVLYGALVGDAWLLLWHHRCCVAFCDHTDICLVMALPEVHHKLLEWFKAFECDRSVIIVPSGDMHFLELGTVCVSIKSCKQKSGYIVAFLNMLWFKGFCNSIWINSNHVLPVTTYILKRNNLSSCRTQIRNKMMVTMPLSCSDPFNGPQL